MIWELDGMRFEVESCEEERCMLTSLHGLLRVMARFDVNEKRATKIIHRAWEKGKVTKELPLCHQREYMTRHKILMHNGYSDLRVYQNHLFVFAPSGKFITVYPLPKNFDKHKCYDRNKQPVRNFNNYRRMFPEHVTAC